MVPSLKLTVLNRDYNRGGGGGGGGYYNPRLRTLSIRGNHPKPRGLGQESRLEHF